jgi:hypothetical protein
VDNKLIELYLLICRLYDTEAVLKHQRLSNFRPRWPHRRWCGPARVTRRTAPCLNSVVYCVLYFIMPPIMAKVEVEAHETYLALYFLGVRFKLSLYVMCQRTQRIIMT